MTIEIFVQARMSSTRLPGKVLKPVLGKPLLTYLCERLKRVSNANVFRILTSKEKEDDVIANYCIENGISYFRGSLENVLDRYYQAALVYKPDAIVRITADCPLIDPNVIDNVISTYKQTFPKYDYVSNSLERTFPRGMDAEIFSFNALKITHENATKKEEQEHVTLHMYRNPEQFRCLNVPFSRNLSHIRLTVDTKEDFELVRIIIKNLYPSHPQFNMQDILNLLDKNPDFVKINGHITQKSY